MLTKLKIHQELENLTLQNYMYTQYHIIPNVQYSKI